MHFLLSSGEKLETSKAHHKYGMGAKDKEKDTVLVCGYSSNLFSFTIIMIASLTHTHI